MPQQKRLDEEFAFPAERPILTDLRRLTRSIESRFRPLEAQRSEFTGAIDTMREVALTRINDFLLPAIDKILALTTVGFLTADSSSSVVLVQGQTKVFVVDEGPQRDLFHPTEFVDISRKTNLMSYALGRTVAYDAPTGALTVTLESVSGPAGPFTDWSITDTAGTVAAVRQMSSQVQAAYQSTLVALADAQAVASVVGDPDQFLANLQAIANQAQAAADAAAQFDPNAYVTEASLPGEFTTRLANYITSATLTSILQGYVTTNALSGLATSAQLSALTARVAALESQGFATTAQIRSKASGVKIDMAGAYNAAAYVPLTDSATITLDFNTFENAWVLLQGSPRTLAIAPGTLSPGQSGMIEFVQDQAGSRSLIYTAGQFAFAGSALTLSTAANKRDAVQYVGLRDGRALLTPAKSLVLP